MSSAFRRFEILLPLRFNNGLPVPSDVVADTLLELTLWHGTQRITWTRGVCIFECDVDGLDEILWWVLGYGHHARVVAPPELADLVVKSAELMFKRYQERSSTSGGVARKAEFAI